MGMKRKLVLAALLLAPLGLACATLCRQAPVQPRPAPPSGAEARLRAHVERLAAAPRVGRAVVEAAAYIEAELRAMGHDVERQPVTSSVDNLSVRLGGEGKRLIIGAHYDSHADTPGADDNASGVAVVLELARALAGREDARPLELVFYPNEEPPWFRTEKMGSAVHAKSVDEADFAGMISVEMVGYFSDEAGTQELPSVLSVRYPDTGNFLAVIGRGDDGPLVDEVSVAIAVDERLPIHTAKLPTWVEGVDFSDHLNYWARDLPAVMITDTAFLRNHAYHEPGDTPDRLDYARMALLVDGLSRLSASR
jgi:hypothetical protein